MASRREPAYRNTVMNYSWKHAKLDGCWTGLYFIMEQKVWAVAFILALLKTRLDLFHDEMDRDGTIGK